MTTEKSEIKCKLSGEEIKAFNIVYNTLEQLYSEMCEDGNDTVFANDNEYDEEELTLARVIIDDIRQSKDHIIIIDRS